MKGREDHYSRSRYKLHGRDKIIDNYFISPTIYPLPGQNLNILNYFLRKDSMKQVEDNESMAKKKKVILYNQFESIPRQNKNYLIVAYTDVLGQPRFCSTSDKTIFGEQCPYSNCHYTCNHSLMSEANLLLMHKHDINMDKLPEIRDPNQIWLFWLDEANEDTPKYDKLHMNWTMSYKFSAEASLASYGITLLRQEPLSHNKFKNWINQNFKQRHNQAICNCQPKKRLQYYYQLRPYFPIVVRGKCIPSNESDPTQTSIEFGQKYFAQKFSLKNITGNKCDRNSNCEKNQLTTNKFYLAFESQTCSDYITEKFWRAFAHGTIPIVYGPSREHYLRIAPPNSFIYVDDYKNKEDLANHLFKIASNQTEYEKYHKWRQHYHVKYLAEDVDPYRFCELCYRLNTINDRIWYENMNDWFLEKCR
ncbi:unnamed protein product [Didymodactylos carnosus]|uniref:Fucosyltransferase n=1 Tax=Didymodactylos carnosus TaxID=1234261 RepID=A0A813V6K2_9BILA|nr:unnamed protein product [Didymodactylos carnosus]CAF3628042.1 unnamed protein product [Didymodactylos carnosus]